MQFSVYLSVLAGVAGAVIAHHGASQQAGAPQQSPTVLLATGHRMTVRPTATVKFGSQGAAKPTGKLGKSMSYKGMAMGTGARGAARPTGKSSNSTIHKVMVSDEKGALKFTPATVEASIGHMVEFMFMANNHSVSQAAYNMPCHPLQMARPATTGFYSGFMAVKGKDKGKASKQFTIMVESLEPMWFYCSQGKHCQAGMVGVINPPPSGSQQSLQMFRQGAKNVTKTVVPKVVAGGINMNAGAAMGTAQSFGQARSTGGVAQGTGKFQATSVATISVMPLPMPTSAFAFNSTPIASTGPASAGITPVSNSTVSPSNLASGRGELLSQGSPLGLLSLFVAALIMFS